jgi:Uma2 family endonuclease
MLLPERTGLTRDDLDAFPDDGLRRELIDGELFVSARPALRHQMVMARLIWMLVSYCDEHGGLAVTEPNNDYSPRDHIEPDLVVVRADHQDRLSARGIEGAPDVVVEISSPSTRGYDLVRKRAFYEREGVVEYWFVDLDEDVVIVHRLRDGAYGMPVFFARGTTLTSPVLPGLVADVDALLGPAAP